MVFKILIHYCLIFHYRARSICVKTREWVGLILDELAQLYHIPIPKQTDLPISYNIAPSQKVLTIRFNPEIQQRSLDALQWGLIPY